MRSPALVSVLLLGCADPKEDPHGGADSAAFVPALAEASGTDRVGSYAHTLPDAPRTVIFLGDSITAGAGAPGTEEDYARLLVHNAPTWPDWEGRDLASRYPGIGVVDVSEGGAWTGTVLGDQLDRFEEQVSLPLEGEALVIMTVGGNDLQSVLLDPGAVDERVDKTVDNWAEIAAYFLDEDRFPDGSTVLLANVYEPTDGVGQAAGCFYGLNLSALLPSLHAANTQLRERAEALGFSALDLRGAFLGHGFHHSSPTTPHYDADDPSLWLANDCIHPNPRGHHEVRALFWQAIAGASAGP